MKTALVTVFTWAFLAVSAVASSAETELKTLVQPTMNACMKADIDLLERSHAKEFTTNGAGKYKGGPFDLNLRELICYEKKDGNWRAAFWQSTKIQPEEEN